MPVLALALMSSSANAGKRGTSDQTGLCTEEQKTLAGQKQSVSSSYPMLSRLSLTTHNTTLYMATTQESLKDGRLAGIATTPSTKFSSISMLLSRFPTTWTVPSHYVSSTSNPANQPSRGLYGPSNLLPPFELPEHLQDFLTDATDPLSAWELRELREGKYSNSANCALSRIRDQ